MNLKVSIRNLIPTILVNNPYVLLPKNVLVDNDVTDSSSKIKAENNKTTRSATDLDKIIFYVNI